ncbi:TPA: hypothetical protein QDZ23_002054 [Pseudomonas putida]|nr:hypothetical protein [Pseudomonas putida]
MKEHTAARIPADEHLRLAGAREPDLDINRGAVIQFLVMAPMMKHWICPSPNTSPGMRIPLSSYDFSLGVNQP